MQGTQRIRLGVASMALAVVSWSIPGIGVAQRAPTCSSGTLPSGAPYLIEASQDWNAQTDALVVLAHGYRFPQDTVEPLTSDPTLTAWLGGLNVAIAAVNYRKSGLAIKEGAADIEELLELFVNDSQGCGYGRPARAWLVGASEGGLIATLVAERQAARAQPHIDGVVAACGPVGDFRLQLEYITDFRVVFNVLFPGAIPGSAVSIAPDVVAAWDTVYAPAVRELVMSQPEQMQRLLRVTGAAVDITDPASLETSVLTLLRYNVGATNEAVQTLGGVPVDNSARVYSGSGDPALDALIDASAERFTAQPVAVAELEAFYRTSGVLQQVANGGSGIPLVTIHTTGDPLVPYAHEPIYLSKTLAAGAADWHLNIPVERYGHCSFTPIEVIGALAALRILPMTQRSAARYTLTRLGALYR